MRKICIYTSTRAEWGLLRGVAEQIQKSDALQLQLLVSGSHLSAKFGMTVSEIEVDGFSVDERVDILKFDDCPIGVCKVMGLALGSYGDALARLAPDLLVVLGDRYESFCIAASAHVLGIPIAHIHGGELTSGALDEAFRHSITKMSQIHFPACEEYRRRIIQLGENPDYVFNVGALGVENIQKVSMVERDELSLSIGFPLDSPFFLVTFHPVTLETATAGSQLDELFAALVQFPEHRVLFTKANADIDGQVINDKLDAYVALNADRCLAVTSLGLTRYLSAMKLCAAVVGNSSSGILEAPSFHVPTVNIGDRQKGRVRAQSVLDCDPDRLSIQNEINRALSPEFIQSLKSSSSPFEMSDTALSIVSSLGSIELSNILKKPFFDLAESSHV